MFSDSKHNYKHQVTSMSRQRGVCKERINIRSCRERSIMVYKGRSETKMAVKHKLPSLKLRNFESTRLRFSNSTYNNLFYLQLKNLFNRYFHFSVYKQAWQVKLQPSASTWERRFPVSVYFNMEKWKSSPTTKETERRPATSPSQTQKD